MAFAYHDDWDSAQRHMEAWWANGAIDRAALDLRPPRTTPLPGPALAPTPPTDMWQRWTDPDYLIPLAEYQMRHTYYGGESTPVYWPNLGPGAAASYLGLEPILADGTVWFTDHRREFADIQPRFDPDNRWWQATLRLVEAATAASNGNYMVSVTDIGGALDVTASLRGTTEILADLIDQPQEVKRVRDAITALWPQWYTPQESIIHRQLPGSACWLGVWAPGSWYNIQCDISCMMSPKHFDEFVAPELEALCSFLDFTLYHLDGPGAMVHLDRLLQIPGLNGIQWTPGDAAPSAVHWLPQLRKAQAAGKILHLHDYMANVETLCRELSPEGLMIWVLDCPSEEDARDLLRRAKDWHGR